MIEAVVSLQVEFLFVQHLLDCIDGGREEQEMDADRRLTKG